MRAYRILKKPIANLLAKVTSWLLTRLKNGVPQSLTREEIRFVTNMAGEKESSSNGILVAFSRS
jgi:hypothetical protein